MMKLKTIVLAATLAATSVASVGNAYAQQGPWTRAPRQWRALVRQRRRLRMRGVKAEQAEKRTLDEIRRINREVNASMKYATEAVDDWTSGSDCDDYVREKLERLLDAGLPRGALYVTAVKVPGTSQGHLVLIVDVQGEGEVVLDSNFDDVRPKEKVPYEWIAQSVPGTDSHWKDLRAAPSLDQLLKGAKR